MSFWTLSPGGEELLQQRAVIRAELDILTEYNGSVWVRGRELKVTD
jgi:hypothetical protein